MKYFFFLQSTLLQFTFFTFKIHYKVQIHCFFILTIKELRINVMKWPINKMLMLITAKSCTNILISFSDFLTSDRCSSGCAALKILLRKMAKIFSCFNILVCFLFLIPKGGTEVIAKYMNG